MKQIMFGARSRSVSANIAGRRPAPTRDRGRELPRSDALAGVGEPRRHGQRQPRPLRRDFIVGSRSLASYRAVREDRQRKLAFLVANERQGTGRRTS